jgi:hypothetical protein
MNGSYGLRGLVRMLLNMKGLAAVAERKNP